MIPEEAKRQEIAMRDKRHLLPDLAFPPPADVAAGYEAALWAAGLKVTGYKEFGSYQGDWWAEICLPTGEVYYVTGCYGSCSGCDAFEAEFGCGDGSEIDYLHRLKDFGREYLTDCMTLPQAIDQASKNLAWDTDAQNMVDWLKGRAAPSQPERFSLTIEG